jgi:hypothetical protein
MSTDVLPQPSAAHRVQQYMQPLISHAIILCALCMNREGPHSGLVPGDRQNSAPLLTAQFSLGYQKCRAETGVDIGTCSDIKHL